MGSDEKLQFQKYCVERLVLIIHKHLRSLTNSICISEDDIFGFAQDVLFDKLWYDIERLVELDPAIKNSNEPYFYASSYKGVNAIINHRLANHLIYKPDLLLSSVKSNDKKLLKGSFHHIARIISEDAAKETTIEINPAANIGKGLIIDHGTNTKILGGNVFGETCEIGEDCIIMNGVILGVSTIYKKMEKRRHPKIGNRVTICANARIFGSVTIGDDVFIASNSVVTTDIPSNSDVTIVNQLQINKNKSNIDKKDKIKIFGLFIEGTMFYLKGKNLSKVKLSICSSKDYNHLMNANILKNTNEEVIFNILNYDNYVLQKEEICLHISSDKQNVYLLNPEALLEFFNKNK